MNFKRSKDQSEYSLTDSRRYLFKKPLLSHGFCKSGKHASGRGEPEKTVSVVVFEGDFQLSSSKRHEKHRKMQE